MIKRSVRIMRWFLFSVWMFTGSSCAIHYFDSATGTEHLFGIGHMKMKAVGTTEGLRAVVSGTDTFGISAGSTTSEEYLSLGWQQLSRLRVLDADAAIRLEWPSSNLFSVRIGSSFPPQIQQRSDRTDDNH